MRPTHGDRKRSLRSRSQRRWRQRARARRRRRTGSTTQRHRTRVSVQRAGRPVERGGLSHENRLRRIGNGHLKVRCDHQIELPDAAPVGGSPQQLLAAASEHSQRRDGNVGQEASLIRCLGSARVPSNWRRRLNCQKRRHQSRRTPATIRDRPPPRSPASLADWP